MQKDFKFEFIDGSPGDLELLYEELTQLREREQRIMSEETKKTVENAKEFFKQVKEGAERFQKTIPDKRLGEKLKKVQESSQEVIKHITDNSEK